MNAIQVLLTESIDYAGLFPPAGLNMPSAVRNYHEYRTSPEAWALGKFVVPASRLGEFQTAAAAHLQPAHLHTPWQLSVLAGPDLAADIEIIAEFNRRYSGMVAVRSIEVKATSVPAVEDTMRRVPRDLEAFIEIPIDSDPGELLRSIARVRARAKVRTGGVTEEAFPRSANLLRFLRGCADSGVPFKATAGLHHPLRAEYRLTYAADSPEAPMFGFLNVMLAAAFLGTGMTDADAARVLEERLPSAFHLDGHGISWRGYRLEHEALRRARKAGMISFGSCSFTEPLSDLENLHLLPPGVQPA